MFRSLFTFIKIVRYEKRGFNILTSPQWVAEKIHANEIRIGLKYKYYLCIELQKQLLSLLL
jgi:hypothetical protein